MCAVTYKTGDPYRLAGNRMIFANWYYVRPCSFSWKDAEGRIVSVKGDQGPFEAHFKRTDPAWGVQLAVKSPVTTEMLIKPEHPWEAGGVNVYTVMKDAGKYRAWANNNWGDLNMYGEKRSFFCYYESDDGLNWERPDCGLTEYGGNKRNNLLLAENGGSVFIDPSAPPAERYKWIAEHHFSGEAYEEYKRRRPDAVDRKSRRLDAGLLVGARGAVSPDGIRWKIIPQPLVMMHTDTQVTAYYDNLLKKYVGYFRDWMAGPQAEGTEDEKQLRWMDVGRRVIGRAETADFREFPLSEVIVEPRLDMGPSQVLYTNCRTAVPGAPDIHLMFPAVWDTSEDTTHMEVLSSHDGKVWNYLSDGAVLNTGDFGGWDGGCIFPVPNLIELPGGDFALPYTGYSVPHKYPRVKATRGFGYAIWPKGRLVALEAKEKGEFTTVAVVPPGGKLLINAVTRRAGRIEVEALDCHNRVIPGRDFEHSVPVIGDQYRTPVRWKEHGDLGITAGEAVSLRFRMEKAGIYSLEFVS